MINGNVCGEDPINTFKCKIETEKGMVVEDINVCSFHSIEFEVKCGGRINE
jgi:hypothetical protein